MVNNDGLLHPPMNPRLPYKLNSSQHELKVVLRTNTDNNIRIHPLASTAVYEAIISNKLRNVYDNCMQKCK